MKMSKELKIGSFAVMVFVLSFFVINFLRGEDIFNREIELTASYDNVEGLVPSAPVYIKGYKAGKVVEVEYDKEQQLNKIDKYGQSPDGFYGYAYYVNLGAVQNFAFGTYKKLRYKNELDGNRSR